MHSHVTQGGPKGMTAILGSKLLTYLGTISFPIFVLHGALGQVRKGCVILRMRDEGGCIARHLTPGTCTDTQSVESSVESPITRPCLATS